MSRFLFSLFYHPAPDPEQPLEPTIAVVMPAFNEEDAVADSIRSLLAVGLSAREARDRGRERRLHRRHAARDLVGRGRQSGGARDLLPREPRQARRDGGGHPRHPAAVVAFVDSDSSLERDALRKIVRGFADPKVGAIAGHAEVENARES